MRKGSIQEAITIVNVCAPKYVKQKLMDVKAEINNNTTVVGDFG